MRWFVNLLNLSIFSIIIFLIIHEHKFSGIKIILTNVSDVCDCGFIHSMSLTNDKKIYDFIRIKDRTWSPLFNVGASIFAGKVYFFIL